MGVLKPSQIEDWRKGRIPYLERVTLGGLGTISRIMKAFRAWAKRCQLLSRETVYLAKTKGPKRVLQFSKTNNPHIEKFYRTHFIAPYLVQKKKHKVILPALPQSENIHK